MKGVCVGWSAPRIGCKVCLFHAKNGDEGVCLKETQLLLIVWCSEEPGARIGAGKLYAVSQKFTNIRIFNRKKTNERRTLHACAILLVARQLVAAVAPAVVAARCLGAFHHTPALVGSRALVHI